MFLNGLSPARCIEMFVQLATKTFQSRFPSSSCWILKLIELATSVFADAKYPAKPIEDALKEVFGSEGSLLDYSAASARDAKVGVTLTGVPSGEFVASNWNGSEPTPAPFFQHLFPDKASEAIKTWDA